jgi:hypothetical protein
VYFISLQPFAVATPVSVCNVVDSSQPYTRFTAIVFITVVCCAGFHHSDLRLANVMEVLPQEPGRGEHGSDPDDATPGDERMLRYFFSPFPIVRIITLLGYLMRINKGLWRSWP